MVTWHGEPGPAIVRAGRLAHGIWRRSEKAAETIRSRTHAGRVGRDGDAEATPGCSSSRIDERPLAVSSRPTSTIDAQRELRSNNLDCRRSHRTIRICDPSYRPLRASGVAGQRVAEARERLWFTPVCAVR